MIKLPYKPDKITAWFCLLAPTLCLVSIFIFLGLAAHHKGQQKTKGNLITCSDLKARKIDPQAWFDKNQALDVAKKLDANGDGKVCQ